jgi:hypothetical protein
MLAGVMEPADVSRDFDAFFEAEYRPLLALATALCGSRYVTSAAFGQAAHNPRRYLVSGGFRWSEKTRASVGLG